jgi:hypothetical protein
MKFVKFTLASVLIFISSDGFAQVSPGELSVFHESLEGLSNCTQCHVIGAQVSNEKCLACHTEIKDLITANKGYHSSSEIKGKRCADCHSDHHGRNFKIVKFDEDNFNHNLTGFALKGAHVKKNCSDCHTSKFISASKIKSKKITFLGLKSTCANCHTDYHQNTLSKNCNNCHDETAFKPASKFSHSSAKFQLTGKHQNVECIKCHKVDTRNGEKFQEFTGLQFSSCINCHVDPHKNQFGANCMQCHSNESFTITKEIKGFDHSKTRYNLEDKHRNVECKSCHKVNFSTPLKYQHCTDCHKDYHNGQFAKNGVSPDCSFCHNLTGYNNFSYTIDQHNTTDFPLAGAHSAISCTDCHKKTDKWIFKNIGMKCKDCHKDIHANTIDKKYYPDQNCMVCHNQNAWRKVDFDHTKTSFTLVGAHVNQDCRVCHFKDNGDGSQQQNFSGLSVKCVSCHVDKHFGQFEISGITDCNRCHGNDMWKPAKFDHNTTAFKLIGGHANVACIKCHKPTSQNNNIYIQYKISTKCESCHL